MIYSITGVSGFIGAGITAYLPNKGYKTGIPDYFSMGKRENIFTYNLNNNSGTLTITGSSIRCKGKRVLIDFASAVFLEKQALSPARHLYNIEFVQTGTVKYFRAIVSKEIKY